jgi:hypothetical protein
MKYSGRCENRLQTLEYFRLYCTYRDSEALLRKKNAAQL